MLFISISTGNCFLNFAPHIHLNLVHEHSHFMFYIGRLSLSIKVSRYRTVNAAHQTGILISLPEIPIKADELAANDDCMNYLTGGGSVLGKLPSMELCNITSPQRHIKALKDTLKENSDIKKLSLIVGTNLSIKLTDFYPLFLHILCSSASNFLHFLTVSFTAITESWLQGEQVEFSVRHLAMIRQLALLTEAGIYV